MRDRSRLATMTRLASVQRAKRVGAEAALIEARSAEEEARSAEAGAREAMSEAHREWLDHIAIPRFSPEFSAMLSHALIGCEATVGDAVRQTTEAEGARTQSQAAWQVLEARVRTGEEALRVFRRKVARRAEENRIAELADRTTYAWSRT